MEKLKRYNQKLLAILGTVAVVGVTLALLFWLVLALFPVFESDRPYEGRDDVLVATAVVEEKAERINELTFGSPIRLDTSSARYIIPVGHIGSLVETEEAIERSGLLNTKSYSKNYRSYAGTFNNFIFQDFATGTETAIFNSKSVLTSWTYLKTESTEVLLFKGSQSDTNENEVIDAGDEQTLFVYYLEDQVLKPYFFPGKTVLSFDFLPDTNLLAIQLGVDRDGDHTFHAYEEPKELLGLDLDSRNTKSLVSEELKEKMQALVN